MRFFDIFLSLDHTFPVSREIASNDGLWQCLVEVKPTKKILEFQIWAAELAKIRLEIRFFTIFSSLDL